MFVLYNSLFPQDIIQNLCHLHWNTLQKLKWVTCSSCASGESSPLPNLTELNTIDKHDKSQITIIILLK